MPDDEVIANQQTILSNQQRILANQKRIEANQGKLDKVVANQAAILATAKVVECSVAVGVFQLSMQRLRGINLFPVEEVGCRPAGRTSPRQLTRRP